MRCPLLCNATTLFILVGAAAPAHASGPEWTEAGDAGNTPGTAQIPQGNGLLGRITGTMTGSFTSSVDFQDMFLVHISDPANFSMSLDPGDGGGADFNTQLWLFDAEGLGLLANDDISDVNLLSAIGNTSNDGTGIIITTPGRYFIAFSGFNSDPISSAGLIFDQASTTEISGPDGPGGLLPIIDWSDNGDTGSYTVTLTGVSFVPAPGTGALLLVAAALGRRRRRA